MKMTGKRKALSLILCMVLIAALALTAAGCADRKDAAAAPEKYTELGEGSRKLDLTVTDGDGKTTGFHISTDEDTVGGALIELGLISGDEGEFGLYVKTVSGITADYDKDKCYWAFYIDGEYAMTGAELTEIHEGSVYSFKVEK